MREFYLDNAATTRVDPEVAELALHLMREEYGNPSSLHRKGFRAQQLLEEARRRVAGALGCDPGEVLFTSGGTEANNLALLGVTAALRRKGNTVVTTGVEHSSVLEPLRHLESQGWTVRYVTPRPDGGVDADAVLEAVDPGTVLVSCMMVNSEVGAILPVREIADGLKRRGLPALLHCDAVQGFGKLPWTVSSLGADLVSVSAHKIHAPKGCGALYRRRGVRLLPIVFGGGQEGGIRSGTESTPLLCAFGLAAERAQQRLQENYAHMVTLRNSAVERAAKIQGVCINSPADGTPYLCNLSLPGYRSETLLNYFAERGLYLSSGSACAKGAKSHVLKAMGLPDRVIDGALRISFCHETSEEALDRFFQLVDEARQALISSKR